MKKNWLNRLIVSYLPIFIIINSLLIFIFFLVLSDQAKNQAYKANHAAAGQVMQSVEYKLESIHELVLKELRSNEYLRPFFNESIPSSPLVNAKVSSLLNGILLSNNLIDSIYFYRDYDGMVLTNRMMIGIDQFGDREFALAAYQDKKMTEWTSIREYHPINGQDNGPPVVSLVRRYPVLAGDSGIIVVNLEAASLQKMIDGMTDNSSSFMDLYDQDGHPFLDKKLQFSGVAHAEEETGTYKVISNVASSTTNWEIRSGYRNVDFLSMASIVYNVWVWLGVAAILLGAAAVIFLSRRNYKPVELILQSLNMSQVRTPESKRGKRIDEFNLIASAIHDLIEQSDSYKKRQNEDLAYRRKHFFKEIMEGTRPVGQEEWNQEMSRLGLRTAGGTMVVAAMEIDRYSLFANGYSHHDQYLLKYALSAIIHEIAEQEGVQAWSEWISNRRLGVLLQYEADAINQSSLAHDISDQVRDWVKANMNFTVTLGIGSAVDRLDDLSLSYEEAQQALKYKPVLGSDTTISTADAELQPQGELYRLLQTVRSLSQSFRLNEEQWKEQYEQFFNGLREGVFTRDDIINLLNYLTFHLQKEMMELPTEFQKVWRTNAESKLAAATARFELLEEVRDEYFDILLDVSSRLAGLRKQRQNHSLIQEIKVYLEHNYGNPDLSLDHISDHFNLSPKYFSRLFKEEFGEKFTDFIAKVRVQEAKKMLIESDAPVHVIASKVGYVHTLSFIRMFKKITSVTPGYFRSEHQASQVEH
ncbi:helix-turn-helix domain-containing protein [Paenibacillus marinisediminis]